MITTHAYCRLSSPVYLPKDTVAIVQLYELAERGAVRGSPKLLERRATICGFTSDADATDRPETLDCELDLRRTRTFRARGSSMTKSIECISTGKLQCSRASLTTHVPIGSWRSDSSRLSRDFLAIRNVSSQRRPVNARRQ